MKKFILTAAFFFGSASAVFAKDPPTFSQSIQNFDSFMTNTKVLLNNIMNDNLLNAFINAEWNCFAIILIVIALSKYILDSLALVDLIQPLLIILISRILLDNFDFLTSLCWDMSEGISTGIQRAAIGSADPSMLPAFINDVAEAFKHTNVNLLTKFWTFLAANAVFGMIFLFSVVGFIAQTWALYGYALSKIIGLFFIPFMMLKKTSFLFDGWVRLFTGFLVYGVIAKANLILAVIAFKTLFGLPGYAVDTSYNISLDFDGLSDIMGLVGFMLVSLLALISTGRFASSIVSGAQGFGGDVENGHRPSTVRHYVP